MPIHNMQDLFGRYYQYGHSGKKYYYTIDPKSEKLAYKKALKQAKAIEVSKHKKKIIKS